ncbi:hypothetical protein BH23ACT9_BH23ACT9_21000 [soil metagenome]
MIPDTHTDSNADNPTRDRMRAALHGAAAGLDLDAPGTESVRAAAHHRARRQQRMTAGIATVAVVAGAVGIAGITSRQPGVELGSSAVGSSATGIDFTWVSGEHVLSHRRQIVQGADGVLYALSTAPGVTYGPDYDGSPLPQAVYRSTDGLEWQATELDPALQLTSLDVTDSGLLYGLSTAPGSTDLRIASSSDGGSSWQLDDLPPTSPAPAVADGIQLASSGSVADIAVNGATTVVTTTTQWYIQVEGLLTDAERETSHYVEPTAEGLVVRMETADGRMEDSPTPDADLTERTITWSEVGLEGPEDLVTTDAFVSAGDGWQPVALPMAGTTTDVEPTAEGFAAIIHTTSYGPDSPDSPVRVARSADGAEWTLDETPLGVASYVQAVGTAGDRTIVSTVVSDEGSSQVSQVASSGDAARTWQVTDLGPIIPAQEEGRETFTGASDIGPLGIAVTAGSFDPSTGEGGATALLFSTDGLAWDVVTTSDMGIDGLNVSWVSVERDRVILSTYTAEDERQTVVGVPTR